MNVDDYIKNFEAHSGRSGQPYDDTLAAKRNQEELHMKRKINVFNNKRAGPGTADETEFTLEEREINGQIVMVKVYKSKYDKYKYKEGRTNPVRPKTSNGGKC